MLIGALLVVGALARIWGADYGLPHTYHPDEGLIVNRAVRFHGGDLDPRFFNWPSLYMYLLSAIYGLAFGLGGVVDAFGQDPTPFYLIGRTVTALAGTATIAVVYMIAAELYGATTGLLAALFLAVNLLHIRDSHYITTDVPLTFLISVALLFALRYWREGRGRDAATAGLVTGLAASMKYPGGLMLLPLVLAHALAPGRAGWRAWRPSRALVGAAGLALVGFLLGTPYAVLTPLAFLGGVWSELREVHTVQFGNEADMSAVLFHLLHSFPEGMGIPLFVLTLVGLGLLLARPGRREIVLLAFPLTYFAVIASWSSRFERYTLPLLPFLVLFAAHAVATLPGWLRARVPSVGGRLGALARPGLGLTAAAVLLVAPEVARAVQWHRLLSRADTREVAGAWIEREIPAGARIAMEPYSPAIRLSPAMVRAERDRLGGGVSAQIARQRFDLILERSAAVPERGYWLFRLDVYDFRWLAERQVEYVVLSGFTYQRYRRACDRYPVACRFYAELERRGPPLYEVDPGVDGRPLWVGDIYSPLTGLWARVRPGPPIKVYRVPAAG